MLVVYDSLALKKQKQKQLDSIPAAHAGLKLAI